MTARADAPPVSVLGAGSWGTALGMLIARNGFPVSLWDIDPGHVEQMRNRRENPRYLPGIPFPAGLDVYSDITRATAGTSGVLVVVPSHAFRATLQRIAPLFAGERRCWPGAQKASTRSARCCSAK